MKTLSCLTLALVLALLVAATPCLAQKPAAPDDIQKQIDALKAQVAGMQKDIDTIKDVVARLRASQGQNLDQIVLDLGVRPVRGSASARLLLIEFTDYQ